MVSDIEKVMESFKARKKSCECKLRQLPFEGKQPKHITDKYIKLIKFYSIAIQAFEKQKSKKVVQKVKNYSGLPVSECPSCGNRDININYNYCSSCGQKISWEVESK